MLARSGDQEGTLLKQFLTPAEYEDVPWRYKGWYDQLPYRDKDGHDQSVYILKHVNSETLERVECRAEAPPPARAAAPAAKPPRPPAPDPPLQPSHSSDWDHQWFKDDSGIMFPYI